MLTPDATPEGQDWIKQGWDLPPYKSIEFYSSIGGEDNLKNFKKLPIYTFAVRRGFIKNDEWDPVAFHDYKLMRGTN